jgi:hypothetical protein
MENLGIFYGHLVYFTAIGNMYYMAIWYILWSFGIFLTVLVFCTKKNLATLTLSCVARRHATWHKAVSYADFKL